MTPDLNLILMVMIEVDGDGIDGSLPALITIDCVMTLLISLSHFCEK
jgi:hypothetical protein